MVMVCMADVHAKCAANKCEITDFAFVGISNQTQNQNVMRPYLTYIWLNVPTIFLNSVDQ